MNNFIKTLNLLQEKVNADDSESFDIGKNLTDKEVKEKCKSLKFKKDHRGRHYDPKSGIITFI